MRVLSNGMGMRRREFISLVGSAAAFPTGLAGEVFGQTSPTQTWPARPIKLIVPSGPGLSADVLARLMSERLSHQLGQQMFVENIAGAAGMVGGQAAARAVPDGYTLYLGLAAALSSNLFLCPTIRYAILYQSPCCPRAGRS